MSEQSWSVTVDQSLCMGSGYCLKVSPAMFSLGDDGIVELVAGYPPVPVGEGPVLAVGELASKAEEASNICPASAIALAQEK